MIKGGVMQITPPFAFIADPPLPRLSNSLRLLQSASAFTMLGQQHKRRRAV
ncbi:hypothetical protein [Rhizobium sp. SL42]|uniref:hypothetical protein n=1 Tax=Rhizobium sp. SL42 TaxID=2806346 RepID=UPI001F241543|nr:hypothetical protein [Rhizobium sp. SL42]UJW74634.1 hypothetical protein IM739_17490 [Rhizobium sp. SL42]